MKGISLSKPELGPNTTSMRGDRGSLMAFFGTLRTSRISSPHSCQCEAKLYAFQRVYLYQRSLIETSRTRGSRLTITDRE